MKDLKYWNSETVGAKYLFEINKKDRIITLGLKHSQGKNNFPPAKKNEFFEGLWQYDVLEAFISTDDKSYIEINLSINGAWWVAEFSDYRQRIEKKPEIELIEVSTDKNSVIAKFSYKNINFREQYNVCAILDKKYLSLNSVEGGKEADFHLERLRE